MYLAQDDVISKVAKELGMLRPTSAQILGIKRALFGLLLSGHLAVCWDEPDHPFMVR